MVDQVERVFTVKADGTPALKLLEQLADQGKKTEQSVSKLSNTFSNLTKNLSQA